MLKCLRRMLEMRGSAGLYVTTNGKMLKCLSRVLEMPLVHTLLTASRVIPFTLQVKHAPSLHTPLVTLKT